MKILHIQVVSVIQASVVLVTALVSALGQRFTSAEKVQVRLVAAYLVPVPAALVRPFQNRRDDRCGDPGCARPCRR